MWHKAGELQPSLEKRLNYFGIYSITAPSNFTPTWQNGTSKNKIVLKKLLKTVRKKGEELQPSLKKKN